MQFRRIIFNVLLVGTMIGSFGALPTAAAAPPNSANTSGAAQQTATDPLTVLQSQLNQQGVDVQSLLDMIQQTGLGSRTSTASTPWYSGMLKSIFGPTTGAALTNTLLEKALPEACYGVISRDPNNHSHITKVYDQPKTGACPDKTTAGTEKNTVPKTDQSYIWGLTQSGDDLWFGTVANTQCQVEGTYLQHVADYASANSIQVCEFGADGNPYRQYQGLGDWRPPHIYVDDPQTVGPAGLTDAATLPAASGHNLTDDLKLTLGLRSAGSIGDYVMLAGPGLTQGGVNVYVFTASNRTYQGMIHLTKYDGVRKWLSYNGVLYTAMHNTMPALGGSVLKWVPDPNDLLNPDAFVVVGHVDGDPAEIIAFENRIFVNTWADPSALLQLANGIGGTSIASVLSSNPLSLPVAGLWMSQAFVTSLGPTTATWQEPWNVFDYEVDPVTALTYGGGAMAVYNGQLYWGTMHVPTLSSLMHYALYGSGIVNANNSETTLVLNSERAISIFRGANFGRPFAYTQLLYGETMLPVWMPNSLLNLQGPGQWVKLPNRAGLARFGTSGFGNIYNNYTWSMAVYNGSLYIGTMDWSILGGGSSSQYGADLWRFNSPYQPAEAVYTTGVGNPLNYGIRNMITANDGSALYLGMANPANLSSYGGWELRALK